VANLENELLNVAAEFLKGQGVKVVVIGGITVEHRPEERRLNHELVIRFTGQLPEQRLCPVHGMPDCSPLLNGCSELTNGR